MTETTTEARTWDVPAQPDDVTIVTDADGSLWRKTDCPAVDGRGENRWVEITSEGADDPIALSWRSLVRLGGPLTEVVR